MESPLVSALCVTRNRREWLPRAIDNFRRQAYLNTEMVIVSDGDDVSDIVPSDPQFKLFHLGDRPNSLGEKRNLGVQLCGGDIIAHFDDDDQYHPNRIIEQVDLLVASGAAVVGYQNCYFTDGVGRWIYHNAGNPVAAIGSSLCYWRSWALAHPFLARQIGEDGEFVAEAFRTMKHPEDPKCRDRLFAGVSGLGMMVAWRHGGNTSQQRMTDTNYIPFAPFPEFP